MSTAQTHSSKMPNRCWPVIRGPIPPSFRSPFAKPTLHASSSTTTLFCNHFATSQLSFLATFSLFFSCNSHCEPYQSLQPKCLAYSNALRLTGMSPVLLLQVLRLKVTGHCLRLCVKRSGQNRVEYKVEVESGQSGRMMVRDRYS